MSDPLFSQFENNNNDDDTDDQRSESDAESSSSVVIRDTEKVPDHHRTPRGGPQTGPKGVIADHAYYQQMQRAARQQAIADHNAKMLAKAPMTTTYRQDLEREQQQQQQEEEDELLLKDDDEEDEEIMRRFRQQRMEEYKRLHRQRRPLFGKIQNVSADDYVAAIDNESASIPVIVHLYDKTIPQCIKLHDHLIDLAEKYALAKFIRVSAAELDFDLVGSPAILAYRNGILVANLVRLVDCVGPVLSPDSIEQLLLRTGALSVDDRYCYHASDQESNSSDDDDGDT